MSTEAVREMLRQMIARDVSAIRHLESKPQMSHADRGALWRLAGHEAGLRDALEAITNGRPPTI